MSPPQTLSYVILKQTTSWRALLCCAAIICGFLLGLKEEDQSLKKEDHPLPGNDDQSLADQSASISWLGVMSGVMASLCVALFAIITKRTLSVVGDNIWRLQFYNNLNAVVILSIVVLLKEVPDLKSFQHWTSPYFWGLLVLAGLFGIAIGYVTSLQIQVTSPLTHNVSGTAKACAQTILACLVYSESKQFWWWMSNFMVLGGSSGYTYVRMEEMKQEREEANSKTHLKVIEDRESEA